MLYVYLYIYIAYIVFFLNCKTYHSYRLSKPSNWFLRLVSSLIRWLIVVGDVSLCYTTGKSVLRDISYFSSFVKAFFAEPGGELRILNNQS